MPRYEDAEHKTWWAAREQAYLLRPEVQQEIRAAEAAWEQELAEDRAREDRLHDQAGRGVPGAQQALNEELTRQAVFSDPPREPSAKEDDREWEAFFLEFTGRAMPLNAAYEAALCRMERSAPPDVGGLAAEYYEAHDPTSGFDLDELTAESMGLTLEEFLADQAAEQAPGIPGELWIRPSPGALPSGPFPPAEALARFQAGRAANGLSQELLRWTPRVSRVLVGAGTGSTCDAVAWVNDGRGGYDSVVLGAGLAWHDAVALAERVSRIPQADNVEVTSRHGDIVFTFAGGQVAGPRSRWPGAVPSTAGELTRLVRQLPAGLEAVSFPVPPPGLAPAARRRRPRRPGDGIFRAWRTRR